MKKILLLGTGGTIACKRTPDGLKPVITSEEILTYVPDSRHYCEIDSIQILNIDSTNIQPSHWLAVSKAIEEHYEEYDGFVITHGTDTMAYTAAALSYLIQNSPKPIVITGAQKPIDMENTDARTNLAGTRGKKERTKSYNAFSSINFPYIAIIQEDHILFYLDDKAQVTEPLTFYHQMDSSVGLIKLIPSADASLLDYMAAHYDAVIIESFGVGGLPSYDDGGDYYRAVAHWINLGKTVIMTTQVTNEGSNMSVYEVGKKIKREFGLLEAYDMTLEAAVTKIMWILTQTKEPAKVRELFYQTVNHDILWKSS